VARTFENFIQVDELWPKLQELIRLSREWAATGVDPELGQRAVRVLAYTDHALKNADYDLTSVENHLVPIHASLDPLMAMFGRWAETQDWAPLGPNLDHLAAFASALPASPAGIDLGAMTASLRAEFDVLQGRTETLRGELAAHRATADTQIRDLIEARLPALDQKIADYEARLEQRENDAVARLAAQQNAFDEAQIARTSAFEKQLAALRVVAEQAVKVERAALAVLKDDSEAEFRTARERSESAAEVVLAHLGEKQVEVDELVAAIGRTAITGGYGEWEGSERRQANGFRYAAIGLALLAVVVLLFGHRIVEGSLKPGEDPTTAQDFAPAGTSIALGAIASYCGRQAGRHRSRADVARNMAIELTSVKPFLLDIDETKRAEILADLSRLYFGHPDRLMIREHDSPSRAEMLRRRDRPDGS
jgi:hypothetical protein